MDAEKWKSALKKVFSKEHSVKALVALGLCGIALIYLSSLLGSGGKKEESKPEQAERETAGSYEKRLEEELSRIVRAITGEEGPTVLVTLESGSRLIYAENESRDFQSEKEEGQVSERTEKTHVLLKNSEGGQQPLTVTEMEPEVKGVVIVSGRAGDPAIREKLTEAVKTALNISSARVCVTDTG